MDYLSLILYRSRHTVINQIYLLECHFFLLHAYECIWLRVAADGFKLNLRLLKTLTN